MLHRIYCEHGNASSGTIKGGEYPDWLSDMSVLKKNSATWNYIEIVTNCVILNSPRIVKGVSRKLRHESHEILQF
jgi:hypothetical protein